MDGRLKKTWQTQGIHEGIVVDVSDLETGLYFIRWQTDADMGALKLTKR